ncbi:MAG: formate--tetrahydrofolate ligase [Candidatus Ancillula sp.]|jgi:formate--tetrahydrofolate ligase|nr:formate--tetrahydrofolate ligase [Candidatus Ancillula sp.]
MKTDLEIANSVEMKPIEQIAAKVGLSADDLELYGKYKAKIADYSEFLDQAGRKSRLVLVTAINPTPAGEGKTTTTVGLTDALNRVGKTAMAALREPSLGPVFGVKGGAAGGGYAQVVPMEDINLHFTGDFHAIGAAHNLLAALMDNHIKQGNALSINPSTITLKRVVDMNDRQLRNIVDGVSGGKSGTINGVVREDGFEITVASEVMAILCLAQNIKDLKERLGRIVVAKSFSGVNVTAADLQANGAMAALLKDAIKPNIVQTLEGTPVLIHGGPFANIAHGCNSVIATKTALSLVDKAAGADGIVVTEAGFGADLGAEKFIDIKCRLSGIYPDAVVLVATLRALKSHAGVQKCDLNLENLTSLESGLPNLLQHIQNLKEVFGQKVVVALNKFPTDTPAEIEFATKKCKELGVELVLSDVWAQGGAGGEEMATAVIGLLDSKSSDAESAHRFAYDIDLSVEEKINAICKSVYHADSVTFTPVARKQLVDLEEQGYNNLPICMAKTQYSFSDDASLLGAPRGFSVTIRNLKLSAGAGFVVALTGDVMTMPGLPKVPAANSIDIDEEGNITGLF